MRGLGIGACVALALGCSSLAWGQATYRLAEHLCQQWTNELISFPVTFPEKACKEIRIVSADGRPAVFQTPAEEIVRYPDGSIKVARVFVKTDLAPEQTIIFHAQDDQVANKASSAVAGPGVSIVEGKGQVTLESGPVGVKLPLGEFTQDIPAPYQGFKLAANRWTGTSTLAGSPAPQRLVARLLERGPLFAEVELAYQYPEEKRYTLRCRVITGEPVALFTETMNVEPGCGYHYNDYAFGKPINGYPQGRYRYTDKFASSHFVRLTLTDFLPDLAKSHKCLWKNYNGGVATYPIPQDPLKEPWITTLHPWENWQGCDMHVSFEDDTCYLGFMALHAGAWRRSTENYPWVRHVKGAVHIDIPINDGQRCWGVHFGSPGSAAWSPERDLPARQAAGGFTNPPPLRRMTVKFGQIALDRVKDWTLEWADATPVPNPVSIIPTGKLAEVQQRITSGEVFKPFVAQVKRDWANRPKELIGTPNYTGDIYLCTGIPEDACQQYRYTLTSLDWKLRTTFFGQGITGYRHGHNYGMLQIAATANQQGREADILLGSPHLGAAEKARLRARLAAYGYVLTDPDFWPTHVPEIGRGNFNMNMAHDGAVGMLGSYLAGHPRAKQWQAIGESGVNAVFGSREAGSAWETGQYVLPNGAIPSEGMHYAGVTLDSILPFMVVLKAAGGTDYFTHPAFQRAMRWYAGCAPPVDVRFGRSYMPPIGYSHPVNTSQSARWGLAAAMTRQSDPAFSQFMMATWVKQGRPVALQIGGSVALGMLDLTVPAKMPDLASAKWDGWGAILRSHADDPRETFFALAASGPSRMAAHSGSFHLYAKGVPLSLIFGCRGYYFDGIISGLAQNRLLFDQREETAGEPSRIDEFATTPTADFVGCRYVFTGLQGRSMLLPTDPHKLELSEPWTPKGAPQSSGNTWSRFGSEESVPPQSWMRRVLFVKDADPLGPNYFLLSDTFQATLPTQWNLWGLAGEMKLDGDHAHFAGKYGVDLEVYLLTPRDKLVTGAWGPEKNPPERQRLLQQWRGPNLPYLALLYPRGASEPLPTVTPIARGIGARVELPGRVDIVLAGDGRQEFRQDKLRFQGQGALIQPRPEGTRLTLFAGSCLAWEGFVLNQPMAGGLLQAIFTPDGRITGESDGIARTVAVQAPAAFRGKGLLLLDGQPTTRFPADAARYAFELPAGRHRFEIQPGEPKGRTPLAVEAEMSARLVCMEHHARIVAAVLRFAREHEDRLPEPSQWREALTSYGIDKDALACPASTHKGEVNYGYGWWLAGKKLADFPNPALVPVLGDSSTPILGNSMGQRRHDGGAVVAFLDGHASWLPQGCPQFYADDLEDPASFRAVAGREASLKTTWAIFAGDDKAANFHDLVNIKRHDMRAAIATDAQGNHVLQLKVPAGMTATYAALPLLDGLQPCAARRLQFQVEVLIPDLSTSMATARILHAPHVPLTDVTLNGHTGIILGPRSYVPIAGNHPFDTAALKAGKNKVLRIGYATDLSTTEVSREPFVLSILPAFGAAPEKGGQFIVPADRGSCAISPGNTQIFGLILAAQAPFGVRQTKHDVTMSFDRLYFCWE